MARGLQVGANLADAVLVVSLLLLVVGLMMAARPELFGYLGLHTTAKTGLQIALVSGFGAIASALVGRILAVLRSSLGDET